MMLTIWSFGQLIDRICAKRCPSFVMVCGLGQA